MIAQFLKPVDKNESDIQRLRKMHELESRCRRLEKEKALLQKELAELQKKVNNKSMITNRTKMETNGQEVQAPGQVEMKSKRKNSKKQRSNNNNTSHQTCNGNQIGLRLKGGGVAGVWPKQILAVKKTQKYHWPEHYISGRGMAGAFWKWIGNLEKDTSKKIT